MVSRWQKSTVGVAATHSTFSATGYFGSVWLQCSVSTGDYVCGATGLCAISLRQQPTFLCPKFAFPLSSADPNWWWVHLFGCRTVAPNPPCNSKWFPQTDQATEVNFNWPAINHSAVFTLTPRPPTELACKNKQRRGSDFSRGHTHAGSWFYVQRQKGWGLVQNRTLNVEGGWVWLNSSGFANSGSLRVI